MTTILATRSAIYSDSNVDDGGTIFTSPKIFRVRNKLVGCAGHSGMVQAFMAALKAGRKLKLPSLLDAKEDERSFNALVVDAKGIWHFDDGFTSDLVLDEFMATGTGDDAARSTIMADATPEQAIEIACKCDGGSRPPVQVLYLNTKDHK